MEVVNKRRRNFLTLSKPESGAHQMDPFDGLLLECSPQEINSREIYLHLIFLANWNKHDKVCKTVGSISAVSRVRS